MCRFGRTRLGLRAGGLAANAMGRTEAPLARRTWLKNGKDARELGGDDHRPAVMSPYGGQADRGLTKSVPCQGGAAGQHNPWLSRRNHGRG